MRKFVKSKECTGCPVVKPSKLYEMFGEIEHEMFLSKKGVTIIDEAGNMTTVGSSFFE